MLTRKRTILDGRGQSEAAEAVAAETRRKKTKERSNGVVDVVVRRVQLFLIFSFLVSAVAAAAAAFRGGGDIVAGVERDNKVPLEHALSSRGADEACKKGKRKRRNCALDFSFVVVFFPVVLALSLFYLRSALSLSFSPSPDGLALGSRSHSIFVVVSRKHTELFLGSIVSKRPQARRQESFSEFFNSLFARVSPSAFPRRRRARRLGFGAPRLPLPGQARQAPPQGDSLGPGRVRPLA